MMPVYVYTDDHGHSQQIVHPVNAPVVPVCPECKALMWRKPQKVSANWGGLRPSQGGVSPPVQELIASRPKRLDKYEQEHHHD